MPAQSFHRALVSVSRYSPYMQRRRRALAASLRRMARPRAAAIAAHLLSLSAALIVAGITLHPLIAPAGETAPDARRDAGAIQPMPAAPAPQAIAAPLAARPLLATHSASAPAPVVYLVALAVQTGGSAAPLMDAAPSEGRISVTSTEMREAILRLVDEENLRRAASGLPPAVVVDLTAS